MSSVVAVVLVIRLVGEAGLFELGVLAAGIAAGAILGVLLGGVPRLGCSLGMRSDKHRVLGPVTIGNVDGVRGLVCLGADSGTFGIPTRDVAPAALVTMVSTAPAALAVFAYGCLQCVGAGRAVSATALADLGGGSDLTLALRVGTKLGTLLRAESTLLPRIYDELGDSKQTLQGRCCRVGHILL